MDTEISVRGSVADLGGIKAAAEQIGVNRCTIYGWLEEDRIPAARSLTVHRITGLPLAAIIAMSERKVLSKAERRAGAARRKAERMA